MPSKRITARLEVEYQLERALRQIERNLKEEEFQLPPDIMFLVPPAECLLRPRNLEFFEEMDFELPNGFLESVWAKSEPIQPEGRGKIGETENNNDQKEIVEPPYKKAQMEEDFGKQTQEHGEGASSVIRRLAELSYRIEENSAEMLIDHGPNIMDQLLRDFSTKQSETDLDSFVSARETLITILEVTSVAEDVLNTREEILPTSEVPQIWKPKVLPAVEKSSSQFGLPRLLTEAEVLADDTDDLS